MQCCVRLYRVLEEFDGCFPPRLHTTALPQLSAATVA